MKLFFCLWCVMFQLSKFQLQMSFSAIIFYQDTKMVVVPISTCHHLVMPPAQFSLSLTVQSCLCVIWTKEEQYLIAGKPFKHLAWSSPNKQLHCGSRHVSAVNRPQSELSSRSHCHPNKPGVNREVCLSVSFKAVISSFRCQVHPNTIRRKFWFTHNIQTLVWDEYDKTTYLTTG